MLLCNPKRPKKIVLHAKTDFMTNRPTPQIAQMQKSFQSQGPSPLIL